MLGDRRFLVVSAACVVLWPTGLGAQQSPHLALHGREIKGLSPEQTAQYLAGEGMGLALAAELNGHPGPMHVLELAAELELDPEQRAAIEGIFDSMQERAARLGRRIVDLEREIDEAFASREATADVLREKLERWGRLQSEVRYVHLSAHLETTSELTPRQIRRYVELRGYSADRGHDPQHHDPGD